MEEDLFVQGPLCSSHHVPTLLSFSDRIKQCNSGKSKQRHQGSSAVNYMVILKRKPRETPFLAHELQPPKKKIIGDRGKDHDKPREERKIRKYKFYTDCKYNSILKFS